MGLHIQLIIRMIWLPILLVGCGGKIETDFSPEVGCTITGMAVDHNYDDWTIDTNLERTLMDDFLKGIQPTTDISNDIAIIGDQLISVIRDQAGFEGEPQAATSYFNNLDLIDEIISTEDETVAIPEMAVARQLLDTCTKIVDNNATASESESESEPKLEATEGVVSTYANWNVAVSRTKPNETLDQQETTEELETKETRVYLVNYNFSKVLDIQEDPFITRTIWERSETLGDSISNLDNIIELAEGSSLRLDVYKTEKFSTSGYDQPSKTVASWSKNTLASDAEDEEVFQDDSLQCTDDRYFNLSLDKDYDYKQLDIVEFINSEGIIPEEQTAETLVVFPTDSPIKRLKVTVDYATGQVSVFKSDFIRAYVGPEGEILKDIRCADLKVLLDANPEWKESITNTGNDASSPSGEITFINPDYGFVHYDPGYDRTPIQTEVTINEGTPEEDTEIEIEYIEPEPYAVYTGTILSHRQPAAQATE